MQCDICHETTKDVIPISDGTESGESDWMCPRCRGDVRLPNHTDPLTFEEQKDLELQMVLITQLPDPPKSRAMLKCEWENVQRLAETLRLYRETNDPQGVNDSLPARTRINGIDYVPYVYEVLGR